MRTGRELDSDFFARETGVVARELLGTLLKADLAGGSVVVRIVETEAYPEDDPSWQGWSGAGQPLMPKGRAEALFGPAGTCFVYLVYFSNWLLNIVTEPEGKAGCVLIRAGEVLTGHDMARENRPTARRDKDLANGPGKLTECLGVDRRIHGHRLGSGGLTIEAMDSVTPFGIRAGPRTGVKFGRNLPYRFSIAGHPCASRPRMLKKP